MYKVIVIDDDATMCSLLETLLEMEGFQVGKVRENDIYFQAIAREKPDLVLMDVHLIDREGNEISGFDILKNIREDNEINNIYVMMSSGMEFSKRAINEGADGFIQKPYMPEDLIEKIKHAQTLT